jgi:hypothetical protein
MHAALVKFVEDDGRELRQQRIVLQARGQDAFGHDEQPRVGAEAAFEADLPADLAAERPALLMRDPRGNRTRGHAPRLEQDDGAVREESGRNAGGLARAGRRGNHRGSRSPDAIDDLVEERVDRERDQRQDKTAESAKTAEKHISPSALRSRRLNVVMQSRQSRSGS